MEIPEIARPMGDNSIPEEWTCHFLEAPTLKKRIDNHPYVWRGQYGNEPPQLMRWRMRSRDWTKKLQPGRCACYLLDMSIKVYYLYKKYGLKYLTTNNVEKISTWSRRILVKAFGLIPKTYCHHGHKHVNFFAIKLINKISEYDKYLLTPLNTFDIFCEKYIVPLRNILGYIPSVEYLNKTNFWQLFSIHQKKEYEPVLGDYPPFFLKWSIYTDLNKSWTDVQDKFNGNELISLSGRHHDSKAECHLSDMLYIRGIQEAWDERKVLFYPADFYENSKLFCNNPNQPPSRDNCFLWKGEKIWVEIWYLTKKEDKAKHDFNVEKYVMRRAEKIKYHQENGLKLFHLKFNEIHSFKRVNQEFKRVTGENFPEPLNSRKELHIIKIGDRHNKFLDQCRKMAQDTIHGYFPFIINKDMKRKIRNHFKTQTNLRKLLKEPEHVVHAAHHWTNETHKRFMLFIEALQLYRDILTKQNKPLINPTTTFILKDNVKDIKRDANAESRVPVYNTITNNVLQVDKAPKRKNLKDYLNNNKYMKIFTDISLTNNDIPSTLKNYKLGQRISNQKQLFKKNTAIAKIQKEILKKLDLLVLFKN